MQPYIMDDCQTKQTVLAAAQTCQLFRPTALQPCLVCWKEAVLSMGAAPLSRGGTRMLMMLSAMTACVRPARRKDCLMRRQRMAQRQTVGMLWRRCNFERH